MKVRPEAGELSHADTRVARVDLKGWRNSYTYSLPWNQTRKINNLTLRPLYPRRKPPVPIDRSGANVAGIENKKKKKSCFWPGFEPRMSIP
jgi:hypothetical protein